MIKKLLGLCMIFAALAALVRCGRSSDDDAGAASDARVPAGWDGKSDYVGSSFNIQTKNQ